MVTEAGNVAPYAPPANVVGLIRRLRERGLPGILGTQELVRMSIPEGNVSRVLVALRFLGFIDDEGHRTESFERIGKATDEEYPSLLADAVRSAYHSVFEVGIDLAAASTIELENAFRVYEPRAQRTRMITLFKGLCQEANLIPGGPPETRTRRPQVSRPKPTTIKAKPMPHRDRDEAKVAAAVPSAPTDAALTSERQDYHLMHGLIDRLPLDGKWTRDKRDRWLQAVEAMIDVLVEVEEKVSVAGYLGPAGSTVIPTVEEE